MTSKRDKRCSELTFRRTVCLYEQMEKATTTSEATRKLGLTKFREKGKLELASNRDKSWKEPTFRRSVGSYGQTKVLKTTSEEQKKLGLSVLRRNVCFVEQTRKARDD